MRKYLLIPLAILVVLAGCEKNPPVPDPEPEDPVEPIVIPEPPYTVVESSFSTWRSDGLLVGGVLFSPEELKGKKPALILCHGLDGTWKDTEAYGRAAARMGLVACCFDFCGGHDGESKSQGERKDNSILTEISDVGAVYTAISGREDVDSYKIFLMGGSQGGLVSALYAAYNPSKIKALGLMFPAFNLPELVRTYTDSWLKGLDNFPETEPVTVYGHSFYRKYAVDAYDLYPFDVIGDYKGPVLIMHGTADSLVPVSVSRQADTIYDNSDLIEMEGQGHGFDEAATQSAISYMEDFLTELI